MNHVFRNLRQAFWFAGAAFLLAQAGCIALTPESARQLAQEPISADRDAEISRIMTLHAQGKLTDEQTLQIIGALVGTAAKMPPSAAFSAASTPPVPIVRPAAVEQPAPAVPPPPAAPSVAAQPMLSARFAAILATLPAYAPKRVVEGRLRSIGSDTMDRVMASAETGFQHFHPNLRIQHEGRGSSTAIPGLVEGMCDIGPMSRPTKPAEVTRFVERYGHAPVQFRVALDTLAIYVHPDNPIARQGLTLAQLDAIFSSTRKSGCPSDALTWGQLGLGGEWASAPINVHIRNQASGTHAFFRENVLGGGDYRKTDIEESGSEMLVAAVARDRYAIGFSGIGYKTAGVITVPVAAHNGAAFLDASADNAYAGTYPITRGLYLTVNLEPGATPAPLQDEFLHFMLSREGQQIVADEGYYPLSGPLAAAELAKLAPAASAGTTPAAPASPAQGPAAGAGK
jgi:phosphate transport system substrate-binding protein